MLARLFLACRCAVAFHPQGPQARLRWGSAFWWPRRISCQHLAAHEHGFGKGSSKKAAEAAAALDFVNKFMRGNMQTGRPAKSVVNEWAQKNSVVLAYETEKTGPDHSATFSTMLRVQRLDESIAPAVAKHEEEEEVADMMEFDDRIEIHEEEEDVVDMMELNDTVEAGADRKGVGKGSTKKTAESTAALDFMNKFLASSEQLFLLQRTHQQPKSALTEWAQANMYEPPIFKTVMAGPAHKPMFSCIVRLQRDMDQVLGEQDEQSLAEGVVKLELSNESERLLQTALGAGFALDTMEGSKDGLDDTLRVEKRFDSDGGSYTQQEFEDYYGSTWQEHWNAASLDERAVEQHEPREATVPPQLAGSVSLKPFREALPAFEYRDQLLKTLSEHQVIIVECETGCGKTTQVGQYILEDAADKNMPCSIVCTQPRRISAIGVAERVADERAEIIGRTVGYSVRNDKQMGIHTQLLFCTTGVLMRRLEKNPDLKGTTHVVVDEVHERGIESDFLLLALRDLAKRRTDLKIIMMSATMNKDLFSNYFGSVPNVVIPGRTFPVQDFFLEDALRVTNHKLDSSADWALGGDNSRKPISMDRHGADDEKLEDLSSFQVASRYQEYGPQVQEALVGIDQDVVNYDLLASLIQGTRLQELANSVAGNAPLGVHERPQGVLVFLSGAREIETLQSILLSTCEFGQEPASSWVLPLHGGLPPEDQKKAFLHPPSGVRKIVLSTNVAETSITIDDIGYVVDTCRMKEMRYDPIKRTSSLVDTVVSRTNARQRRGRAGRVAPGVAVHVGLTRHRHNKLIDDHQPPEVQRVPLEQLILRILATGLHMRHESCQAASVCAELLEPPDPLYVATTVMELLSLGVLDVNPTTGHESLTALGKHLANLPLDVRLGKLVLFGAAFGAAATDAALTIAAALTSRSPFVAPLEFREEADAAKKRFADQMTEGPVGLSDHLAVLAAYREWDQLPLFGNDRFDFCRSSFLSFKTLTIMSDMKRSLLQTLSEAGFIKRGISARDVANLGRQRGCDGVLPALSDGHVRPCPPVLVAALLCTALFPQVVTARMPRFQSQPKSEKALENAEQNKPKPKYSIKDSETGEQVPVKIQRGSAVANEDGLSSPFLVYQDLVRTNPFNLYVRDVTPVPPLALALFGGYLTTVVQEEKGNTRILTIDGSVKLEMSLFACDALMEIKRRLDVLWGHWVSVSGEDELRHNMLIELGGSQLLEAIMLLLQAQEEIAPLRQSKQDKLARQDWNRARYQP